MDAKYRQLQLNKKIVNGESTFKCEICLEERLPIKDIAYIECGHYFCKGCLKAYYSYNIE